MFPSFGFRSVQAGRQFGVLYLAEPTRAFCAVLGGYDPRADRSDALSRLLSGAAGDCGGGLTPPALARALEARLGSWSGLDNPGPLVFAGVSAHLDRVEVCTAGDLRVHLIANGRLERWTRDHILREDPQPGFPEDFAATMSTIVTRSLNRGGPPPEDIVWPSRPPYRVFVCSEEYHHHEPPERYAADIAGGPPAVPNRGSHLGGLVAELAVV